MGFPVSDAPRDLIQFWFWHSPKIPTFIDVLSPERPFNNFFKHSVPAAKSPAGFGKRISVILFVNEPLGIFMEGASLSTLAAEKFDHVLRAQEQL